MSDFDTLACSFQSKIDSVTHAANVHVRGDLDFVSAPSLRTILKGAEDDGCLQFTVDLSNVAFLDSSGMSALLGTLRRVRERDGSMHLIIQSGSHVGRLFELVGLQRLFTITNGSVAHAAPVLLQHAILCVTTHNMAKILQDKIALITGGSSGLGLATAKRFVAEGAHVYITGRRQSELDAAVIAIGEHVTAVQCDVSDLAALDALYAQISAQSGKLDIVFANAGILEKAPIGQITEGMVDRLFSINAKGIIFTVQKALPLLVDGGAIILSSSTVANKGLPGNSVYAATKAAIRTFARGWANDLRERKIRVNAISPGPIETPGLLGGSAGNAAAETMLKNMATVIPLGRIGAPVDIANMAVFLASDAAAFVNGADLHVDGGWAQV